MSVKYVGCRRAFPLLFSVKKNFKWIFRRNSIYLPFCSRSIENLVIVIVIFSRVSCICSDNCYCYCSSCCSCCSCPRKWSKESRSEFKRNFFRLLNDFSQRRFLSQNRSRVFSSNFLQFSIESSRWIWLEFFASKRFLFAYLAPLLGCGR